MTVPWPKATLARWRAVLDSDSPDLVDVHHIADSLLTQAEDAAQPVRVHAEDFGRDPSRYAELARTRTVEVVGDDGESVIARMGPR